MVKARRGAEGMSKTEITIRVIVNMTLHLMMKHPHQSVLHQQCLLVNIKAK